MRKETREEAARRIEARLTHIKLIRQWLEKHGSITPSQAYHYFGCYRLSARIFDLRHKYHLDIRTEIVPDTTGEPCAKYVLVME